VDKARALLEERRDELRGELDQIERALAGLSGTRRRSGGPRTASPAGRRRRRRGGTRADHALGHIREHPGASASEIAKAMGIKPNYVYRVMAGLEKEGLARKEGKGYHAAAAE
jgi:sugar-specific transcriptional regulator TrmB